MKRNTAMAIAGGVTATVAATTLAVGLNLGIMKSDAQSGPGTFDPVATTTSTSTVAVPTPVADPGFFRARFQRARFRRARFRRTRFRWRSRR